MPVYEYICDDCAHCFEIKQGFREAPVARCPRCQGRVRRVLQAPPIIFKGEGFYVTDHRPKTDSEKADKPVGSQKEEK